MAEKTLTLVMIFLTTGLKISYMMKMEEWCVDNIKGIGFSKNLFR